MVVSAGIGVCGYNSICSLKADKRPKCECIEGYSLIDPNDIYGSCKPDFIQGCKEDELSSGKDLYDVVELRDAGWPTSDYLRLTSSTRETCRESCLKDCLCAVAVLRGGTCWKKKLPLSNGRVDSNRPSVAFIKIRKDNSTTLSQCPISKVIKKNQNGLIRVTSGLLAASVCINFMLFGASCMGFFFIYKWKPDRSSSPQEVPESNLRCFTYRELEEATDGFKEELGRGAFGIVYKGHLVETNANAAVAVKKLSSMLEDGEREFKAELKSIGHTHHKNLVRLLGYCDDGQNRLLVEGSLDVLVDYEAEALDDKERLEIYVMVSMWCIQENPSLRPNMRKVVQMLEGVVEVDDPPCPSPFYTTI
ncbi:Tyrosine-protein kinase [Trema orientale]|uniref:non-specific serine/threonine protein kinase n=1 Tax=Trema orientale TaxID=63057 RepID=A0A2P5FU41_TREOI|nr:Tyrosine-protein kinase [Trema orientale]